MVLIGLFNNYKWYNTENRVCHQTILTIGFIDDATPEQLNKIQKQLNDKYEQKQPLFDQQEDLIRVYIE